MNVGENISTMKCGTLPKSVFDTDKGWTFVVHPNLKPKTLMITPKTIPHDRWVGLSGPAFLKMNLLASLKEEHMRSRMVKDFKFIRSPGNQMG